MAGEVRLGEVAEIIMGQSPPGETYNENGEGLPFFQGVADFKYRWGSTEYIVLRPNLPLPDEFAYCLARGTEFRDFAIQSMTGSSGRQRVPAESLFHFRVVTAPKPIVGQFGQLIKPMFARSSAAVKESRTLAALRDTLLPKLISGQIRVTDAERIADRGEHITGIPRHEEKPAKTRYVTADKR